MSQETQDVLFGFLLGYAGVQVFFVIIYYLYHKWKGNL